MPAPKATNVDEEDSPVSARAGLPLAEAKRQRVRSPSMAQRTPRTSDQDVRFGGDGVSVAERLANKRADAVSWLDPAGSSRQTAAWPQQRRRRRCPVAIGSVGSGLRVRSHEIDRGAALGRVSHLGQTKATAPIDLDVALGPCREKRADPVRAGQREPGGYQR